MAAQTKYGTQINKERGCAAFIPYSSHISENTIMTRQGDFLRIWKVSGISFETIDPEEIALRKEQMNTMLRSIASRHTAIWTHTIRRQISERLHATFDNDFCQTLDKKYYDSFAGYKMMANELYLTLIYRPFPSAISRTFSKSGRRTASDILHDQHSAIKKLDELAHQIQASMRRYELITLTTFKDEQGALCSKALSFLNFLITGEWQKVRLPTAPLYDYLGHAWIFVGMETIELRTAMHTRYAQALDFKDYTSHTEPGLLNRLMYEEYEYVMTQSYSFMDKRQGKDFLERQQNQLLSAEDGSATQVSDLSDAIDQLIQGQFAMGEYHYSLMIFGPSVAHVTRYRASAMAIIQDLGFLAASINTATDAAYYAQLPGNWRYRPRVARLTSQNFAGLASFHNFMAGKRDANPWGPAVTLFKTPSGQPLYFNYHACRVDEEAFDKKLLGNTSVIGQSGSGKTVLLSLLLCQSQKFKHTSPNGYTTVFFDKDEGAKIAIKAMGGQYFTLRNGEPTGFNPFALEPTQANILFLEQWIRTLLAGDGQALTTADESRLASAVRTVMRMPIALRRLTTVTQNMTEGLDKKERENSLVKRLSRWCAGGPFAWVFDNPTDILNFNIHSCYGFDGTAFLDNPVVRNPLALYLLHRMESVIDGRRFIYYMDEFWKWLADDAFSDFAFNKQKTIRKQNGLGVFATQSPSDVLQSKIAKTLIEQCATEIYLPNPKADHHDYVHGFKVSEAEFEIIKHFHEDSRLFLIKQGHRAAIGCLDLSGLEDELAVLSGSTDNIALVDQLIEELGADPTIWLPAFHKKRKERTQQPYRGGHP